MSIGKTQFNISKQRELENLININWMKQKLKNNTRWNAFLLVKSR